MIRYTRGMSRVEEKLEATARALENKGDDAQRLELVQRARRFKRSWVEMAEGLCVVRDTRAYQRWGYGDLHAYCASELQLRGATVDKLLGSYSTLRTHAPEVLRRDGVAQTIPTVDAVDYFARAVEKRDRAPSPNEEDPELISELKRAVFDEARPLPVLRRQFNPLLHPKPDSVLEEEAILKLRSAIRRLGNLLPQVDRLSPNRVDKVKRALSSLEKDLDELQAESAQLAS